MNHRWLDHPSNPGRRGDLPSPAPTGHHRISQRATDTRRRPLGIAGTSVISRLFGRYAAPRLTWPPRQAAPSSQSGHPRHRPAR
jgi:hypothetical protein